MVKQRKIRISSLQEVKEFLELANECDFEINVRYNHFIIDAKSILGVLSMDLTKALTVEYDGEDHMFEAYMDKKDAAAAVA